MIVDTKIFNKISVKQIQKCIKQIIYHSQKRFIPGVQSSTSENKSIQSITSTD